MTMTELLLLIIAIGGAGYVGYLFGRHSALAEQGYPRSEPPAEEDPLPGPRDYEAPTRRSAPPPATAGAGQAGTAPRRSNVAPPPARAGLLDTSAGRDQAKKGK